MIFKVYIAIDQYNGQMYDFITRAIACIATYPSPGARAKTVLQRCHPATSANNARLVQCDFILGCYDAGP